MSSSKNNIQQIVHTDFEANPYMVPNVEFIEGAASVFLYIDASTESHVWYPGSVQSYSEVPRWWYPAI